MLTVCDGCGKQLDRSGVQGDKERSIAMSDLGLCWNCTGSGSWGVWNEPGTNPKKAIEGQPLPAPPQFTKSYARFLARQEGK